jgi:hypothetical protein
MKAIAEKLSRLNYTLRSGGADGADAAFERGAELKEIFIPWNGFNGLRSDGKTIIVPSICERYVRDFHPAPDKLSPGAFKLMNRNAYQVLGPNLDDPVDFVLCWTKDGKSVGGTRQAIQIAESLDVPVFNFGKEGEVSRFSRWLLDKHSESL